MEKQCRSPIWAPFFWEIIDKLHVFIKTAHSMVTEASSVSINNQHGSPLYCLPKSNYVWVSLHLPLSLSLLVITNWSYPVPGILFGVRISWKVFRGFAERFLVITLLMLLNQLKCLRLLVLGTGSYCQTPATLEISGMKLRVLQSRHLLWSNYHFSFCKLSE